MNVYVAWVAFQRRATSISEHLGIELLHFPKVFSNRFLIPLSYCVQAVGTIREIRKRKPKLVWVQTPPTFIPLLLILYRMLSRADFKIVVDAHNAALRRPWASIPGARFGLMQADLVVVHNSEVVQDAVDIGVPGGKVVVLEDPPARLGVSVGQPTPATKRVLVPCSFHDDEPIANLLETCALLPDVEFLITGNVARATSLGYTQNAPANARFTGFMPLEEFETCLSQADVVLGLTTREGIQLSVANEAIGAGRPLVLSDTRILRELFGLAAVFSKNDPAGLAAAIRIALSRKEELCGLSEALRARRTSEWMMSSAKLAAI